MKVYDKMPSGLDCPIVGINVSDPSVVCTANIAPASPHHTLPIYRRFWSSAFDYLDPNWQRLCGKNPSWCATMYVLYVKPKVDNMALLLGDESLDSIVAAALLILQSQGKEENISARAAAAIAAIREDVGLITWQRGRSDNESYQISCLRGFCDSDAPLAVKVEAAADWLLNGVAGEHRHPFVDSGNKRRENFKRTSRNAVFFDRIIDDEYSPVPPTTETLTAPNHFMIRCAYLRSGNLEELMRVGFDHTPVVIAATDRRYSIGVHPGAAVALDVPRLLDRLEQMEAAALAYEKPREAVMAYLAKQPTGWRVENHRITASSLLRLDEVMAAVWACMLGSKKLPAWRAFGQPVKTEANA